MPKFFHNIRRRFLKKKQFLKYFQYAIGEIVLVVIGILIALQVNNWNEQRKIEARKEFYMESLVMDLEGDLKLLNERIEAAEKDTTHLGRLRDRISSSSSTIDTIIKIYRFGFNPRITDPVDFNHTTLETLEASGDGNLLPPEVVMYLNNLRKAQDYHYESTLQNLNHYKRTVNNMVAQYPAPTFPGSMDPTSPMSDIVWSNIEGPEFVSRFNGMLISKYLTIMFFLEMAEDIKGNTNDVLTQLKKHSDRSSVETVELVNK